MTARTLANMTPAEQDQSVGMWFELQGTDYLVILVMTDDPYDGHATVMIPHPVKAKTTYTTMSSLTPRMDLPRAWTPSGEPVPGEWQYHPAYTGVYQDGTTSLNLIGAETYSKQHAEWECADIHRDDPAVRFFPVRRYATDWEEA